MCFDLGQNNGFYSLLFTVMANLETIFAPSRTEITKIVVYVLQRTCMKCSHGLSGFWHIYRLRLTLYNTAISTLIGVMLIEVHGQFFLQNGKQKYGL